MGFTDDWYTDGRVLSVRPSVFFSPTDFIAVTDGISPSVKLDNVVVLFDRYTILPIQLEFNGGQGLTQGWNGFNEATKTWHRRFLRLYIRVPKL